MANPDVKVAVVDDEKTIRDLLRDWLNEQIGFQCVGAWSGISELSGALAWKKPDVILLDVHMPPDTGIDLLPRIKAVLRETRVVMLTAEEDYFWIKQALQRGASGYLLKSGMPGNLAAGINDVMAGGSPLSGRVGRQLIERHLTPADESPQLDTLSPRERLVVHELSEGMVYKEIAAKHGISLETVRTHARRIFRKLGVQNRTEAVLVYMRNQ
jgi:DNA-binding NarL/FixJ family response regulator